MDVYKTATDETMRETIRHGDSNYPFAYYMENIWQFDFHRIDWHWHHELEFLFVSQGTASCHVDTNKFELPEGCGLFINSRILHQFDTQGNTFIPNIVFSPNLLAPEKSLIYDKYIRPVINASIPYQIFHPHTPWQNQILQILSQVFTLQEAKEQNELCTLRLLLQMWDILFQHLDLTSGSSKHRRFNLQQARLQTMMQYIHDRYMDEITLEMIAESASVSKSGALQIFQSGIQISPVAYLIRYRLAQAARQLCTTQKSVSSIAEETGFASSGYFCRKFKQHYYISPNQYRQMQNTRQAHDNNGIISHIGK